MKAKSLSVFRTKLRLSDDGTELVTIGQEIEGDEDHLRALARNGLVELLEAENSEAENSEVEETPGGTKPKSKRGNK